MAAGAFAALSDVGESRHGPRRSRWVFTHMVNIDIAILTLLSSIPVVGKTWALPWVRVVAKAGALPRAHEHRMPQRYPSNVRCRANRDAPWEIWRGPPLSDMQAGEL